MKIHVIQLEPHDDSVSIRDKMGWAKAERILLVFPRRQFHLIKHLDLLLLNRHAEKLGAQLGIVTRSLETVQNARKIGIPVFSRKTDAQQAAWPEKDNKIKTRLAVPRSKLVHQRKELSMGGPGRGGNAIIRFVAFILGVSGFVMVLAVFIPQATITLTPATQPQTINIQVVADPNSDAVNIAGSVPSRIVEIVVEESQTIRVLGTAMFPDQRALGQVVFLNLSESVIGIPAGTVVRTVDEPYVRFTTLEDGVLPSGVGEVLNMPVQAVEPGEFTNLPSNSLVVIEGQLGANSSVTNREPTVGGADKLARSPSDDDFTRLYNSLQERLRQEAMNSLSELLESDDIIIYDTLIPDEFLVEEWFPVRGQPAETLTLTLRIRFKVNYISGSDLELLAGSILDANLADGLEPVPDSLELQVVDTPETGVDGRTSLGFNASRDIYRGINDLDIVQGINGDHPEDATKKMIIYSGGSSPVISITPTWWPMMPLIPFRITIVVNIGVQ
ncbi:MAG: baseplate J/gp47 family protein [Chloroflexota bacterium]